MMKRIAAIMFCAVMLAGCGYDRFADPLPDEEGVGTLPNADIATLRENYFGQPREITENIIIEGYVTANDRSGNFFRSFIIDDGSGAVEVCAGFMYLHNTYYEARRVVIHARGLALGEYNGVMQIGWKVLPYSGYRVEDFGSRAIIERYVKTDTQRTVVAPLAVSVGELDKTLCGRLVRIEGLTVVPDEPDGVGTWAVKAAGDAAPQNVAHIFSDGDGNQIKVYTSGYADFADIRVPSGPVSLTGILMYGKFESGKDGFTLKLRSIDDVEE